MVICSHRVDPMSIFFEQPMTSKSRYKRVESNLLAEKRSPTLDTGSYLDYISMYTFIANWPLMFVVANKNKLIINFLADEKGPHHLAQVVV